jgi:N-acetyl sugar amidotransferase
MEDNESVHFEAYYGLPTEVKFCTRCVISNQRPNSAVEFRHSIDSKKETIFFDEDGVCDACRVAEAKDLIDWDQREQELHELCNRYRRNDGRYDCIVPGSGGKDSFYQSHILKTKFGMHPLTVTWAPHLYTDWGRRNHQRWIDAGFDNFLVTPNSRVHRLLTRLAVDNLFHPFQPFMLGQKILGPRLAAQFGVDLVFYGENEAEYGNPRADTSQATRSLDYFAASSHEDVFISGVALPELLGRYKLKPYEISMYLPPSADKLDASQVQVHYLGHYLRWRPQSAYYYAVEHGGFEASPERTPGTYSKYNSIDDKIDDLHYWTTYIKFGIGRATYDAAQEIRSGEITRDEGAALVKRFDGEWPFRFEKELISYLSVPVEETEWSENFNLPRMTKDLFLTLADQFRSPHLWEFSSNTWRLRNSLDQ